jgi:hypothetical protein
MHDTKQKKNNTQKSRAHKDPPLNVYSERYDPSNGKERPGIIYSCYFYRPAMLPKEYILEAVTIILTYYTMEKQLYIDLRAYLKIR